MLYSAKLAKYYIKLTENTGNYYLKGLNTGFKPVFTGLECQAVLSIELIQLGKGLSKDCLTKDEYEEKEGIEPTLIISTSPYNRKEFTRISLK